MVAAAVKTAKPNGAGSGVGPANNQGYGQEDAGRSGCDLGGFFKTTKHSGRSKRPEHACNAIKTYCAVMPRSLISLDQRGISLLISSANTSDEPP